MHSIYDRFKQLANNFSLFRSAERAKRGWISRDIATGAASAAMAVSHFWSAKLVNTRSKGGYDSWCGSLASLIAFTAWIMEQDLTRFYESTPCLLEKHSKN